MSHLSHLHFITEDQSEPISDIPISEQGRSVLVMALERFRDWAEHEACKSGAKANPIAPDWYKLAQQAGLIRNMVEDTDQVILRQSARR